MVDRPKLLNVSVPEGVVIQLSQVGWVLSEHMDTKAHLFNQWVLYPFLSGEYMCRLVVDVRCILNPLEFVIDQCWIEVYGASASSSAGWAFVRTALPELVTLTYGGKLYGGLSYRVK